MDNNMVVMLLIFIAGLISGVIVTGLIMGIKTSLNIKKLEKLQQEKASVISDIAAKVSEIDRLYSKYKLGKIKYEALKEDVLDKIEDINRILNSNIDILDKYYILHIEHFIKDQKDIVLGSGKVAAISNDVGEKEIQAEINRAREEAREYKNEMSDVENIEQNVAQKPNEPVFDTANEDFGSTFSKPAAEDVEPQLTGEFDFTPEDENTSAQPDEVLNAFESGATVRTSVEDLQNMGNKEQTWDNVQKKEENEDIFSAFESGATARISPEALNNIQEQQSEETVQKRNFSEGVIRNDESVQPSVQNEEESFFSNSFEVEATQEYNSEIISKAKAQFESQQESENFFDLSDNSVSAGDNNIPQDSYNMNQKNNAGTGNSDLITGNDVMDKLDNFFGFDDK